MRSATGTSTTMDGFYQLYLLIILLRAGDIETNPGPKTPEWMISEPEILLVSNETSPDDYHSLAKSLGIDIERLHGNRGAFISVLMAWNADQQHPEINKRELLADSLHRIGLDDLSDKLRSGCLLPTANPRTASVAEEILVVPLSPEMIERCRKDFMHKYKTTICRIKADPLNPDSLVQFQEIYTNLKLEEEKEDEKEEEDECRKRKPKPTIISELEYKDLFELTIKGKKPRRILIQGEAGSGKTTLCAKIAWDWITGKHLQHVAWLLIVPLRESEDYTLGEIAKSYLPEDNPTTTTQLTHFIRSNPGSVLTLYDGLDEIKRKIQKKQGEEGKEIDDTSTQETSQQSYSLHVADSLNKGLGAQQIHEKHETQGDIGFSPVTDRLTEDTAGDYFDRGDGRTEQAEGTSKKSDDYPGQSTGALPGPPNAQPCHTSDNPSGYTQRHDPNDELIIEDIICCDQLKTSVVLVTTRPWKAREIRGIAEIRKEYAFIRVDGFNQQNMSSYIHKYFAIKDDPRANDLIEFIKECDVIRENMAPYPIFVAMLCLMWREIKVERKETIKSLQTYSQFFGEMFLFLKERYVQKITDDMSPPSLDRLINEATHVLKPIAELAFNGLLNNTLIFDERHFQDCQDSKIAACRIGILSQENRIAPMVAREERKRHAGPTTLFPHKLFQEYMAGLHLASLHGSDHMTYSKLMTEVVLPRKEDFKYLLYFTVSQNKSLGIDVMTHLVQGSEERTDFLVDVAFECNDPDGVAVLQHNTTPKKYLLTYSREMTPHNIAGYASVGVDVVSGNIQKN